MKYLCKYNKLINCKSIDLPLSKSISNRLLIAVKLADFNLDEIEVSDSEDTLILKSVLKELSSKINVGKAGTSYRFLAAYLSLMGGEYVLDGDARMRERPIGELVDALRELGATITYLGSKDRPPIQIKGGNLKSKELEIEAGVSSQFISALLLIAPYLPNGIQLKLKGEVVSKPYIQMTLDLMQEAGIDCKLKEDEIEVKAGVYEISDSYKVEADWSSAAFIYEFFAISDLGSLEINGLKEDSIQGDARLAEVFLHFGVDTQFTSEGVILRKNSKKKSFLELEVLDIPDLVPAIVLTAACLGVHLKLNGVRTLFDKESNRLEALKAELGKFEVHLRFDEDSLELKDRIQFREGGFVETYQDHRIAMAFAPLAIYGEVTIDNPEVVGKSFPTFWEEMKSIGIQTNELN